MGGVVGSKMPHFSVFGDTVKLFDTLKDMFPGEHCSTDGVNLGTDEDPDFSNDPGAFAGVGRLQDGDKRPDAGPQDWAGADIFPLFHFLNVGSPSLILSYHDA